MIDAGEIHLWPRPPFWQHIKRCRGVLISLSVGFYQGNPMVCFYCPVCGWQSDTTVVRVVGKRKGPRRWLRPPAAAPLLATLNYYALVEGN